MEGYERVTHAGLAVVAADTGRVLLAQRTFDETDDESVRETWEFPGGHLNEGEAPYDAALREFSEEMGFELPPADVIDGWRGGDNPETGHYQGFVVQVSGEFDVSEVSTPEVQAAGWFSSEDVQEWENAGKMRPEIVATMDWSLVFPETDEESRMTEDETDYSAIFEQPIPIHGVIAPEEVETGDRRGFEAGSMTSRLGRLVFRWAEADIGAHDGAVGIGSVDRMMRKGGLIHWDGLLMNTAKADEFTSVMEFFGGRYGVSVDGDKGALNQARTEDTGTAWFEQVRAAGLTAVDIPAFQEAYVAFGPHPEMPAAEEEVEALAASGNFVTFDRGPGWVTNPKETKTIHDYWTKKGEEGYAKIGWGTPGDFRRAKALIGAKIAKNSPEKMKYLNQIIAQWHFDALGYWPGELGKPGNAPDTPENRKRAATHASLDDTEFADDEWQAVLVSSAGKRVLPPMSYFDKPDFEFDATVIEEPDENNIRRTYGYAAERGVCHIGYDGRCVEPPIDESGEFAHFHLGRTKTEDGYIKTGLITYGIEHRSAEQILSETPTQAHFDDLSHAWAAVRLGVDENGIWFSGVVLPTVEEKWITAIEASGQVSGEWKAGALRTLLTINVPGFPVLRSSAVVDDDGNVLALVASAHGQITDAPCMPTPAERMEALRIVEAEEQVAARMESIRRLALGLR